MLISTRQTFHCTWKKEGDDNSECVEGKHIAVQINYVLGDIYPILKALDHLEKDGK